MASSLAGPAQTTTTQLADAIKLLVEKLTPVAKAAPPPPTNFEQIGAAFSAVAGAAGAVVSALQQVVSVTQQFVQALQPGLIAQFNQAMRDLQATVGVAFTGIFEQGIGFLRQLAGQIAPIFAALKPIVDQIVNTALKNLMAVVQAVVPLLSALIPVVQAIAIVGEAVGAVLRPLVALLGLAIQVGLAPLVVLFQMLTAILGPFIKIAETLFDGLTQVVQAWATVFQVFIETLGAAIAAIFSLGDIKDVIKSVKDAFNDLRNAVLITAARLALLAGSTGFVTRLLATLSSVGQSATGQTSIKGLEQIGKDLAQASVNAAGAGEGGEGDPNAAIVNELQKMIAANKENADNLAERLIRGLGAEKTAAAVKSGKNFYKRNAGYLGLGAVGLLALGHALTDD